jgi:hydrogenase small subunit
MQCTQGRLDLRQGRLSKCRRHLHWTHHARFPDKFMPFMDEPPGARILSVLVKPYGTLIRNLRKITNRTLNKEPKWRNNERTSTTGYDPNRPEKMHPL